MSEDALSAIEAEWLERCDRAAADVDMPTGRYRISRDAAENRWFIEAAEVWIMIEEGQNWPHRITRGLLEKMKRRPRADTHFLAALAFDAALRWVRIGPTNAAGDALTFSVFDEASAWLQAFLKPVADVVYFDQAGAISRNGADWPQPDPEQQP